MSEVIVVAIIATVGSVVGQWLISSAQTKAKKADDVEREARLDERLKGVERRLDTHNNYAVKIGDIQRDIAVIKTEIKNSKESA